MNADEFMRDVVIGIICFAVSVFALGLAVGWVIWA